MNWRVLAALLALMPFSAAAGPLILFEGVLADDEGNLVSDTVSMSLLIYEAPEGGAPVWIETHRFVDVVGGHFRVALGGMESLDPVLYTDAPLWIGVEVDGVWLGPRNRLTDVPRAAAAHWAAKAEWAADVTGQHIHPSALSIGEQLVIDDRGRWVGPGAPGGGEPGGGAPDYRFRFDRLEGSAGHLVCGRRVNEGWLCFGAGHRAPLPRDALQLSFGRGGDICVITADDNQLLCWSGEAPNQLAPVGRFRAVAAGERHSCGITLEGEMRCWGHFNERDAITPPDSGGLEWLDVASAGSRSCGILEGGRIRCWGGAVNQVPEAEQGFVKIEGGVSGFCALTAEGRASCFNGPAQAPDALRFQRLKLANHVCGLTLDGDLHCWQSTPDAHLFPSGPVLDFAVATSQTCILRLDGTAACYGSQANPMPERLTPFR